MKTQNAIIESAEIEEIFNSLTVWLTLSYSTGGQSFGGCHLGSMCPDAEENKKAPNVCGEFIARCMIVAGVDKWSDMKGKVIRVRLDREDFTAKIVAIGHPVKDIWFNPTEIFESWKRDNQ